MPSTRRVVVDLELGRGFGYRLPDLGIAGFEIAVTWDDTDGFIHWGGSTGRLLLQYLLDHAEIVGFNLLSYDNKVLSGYLLANEGRIVEELRERTIDLHQLILVATGRRYSLETVAQNTLQVGKLRPPDDGDVALMAEYCERDVELTRDLDDYRRAFGVLYVSGGVRVAVGATRGYPERV